MTYLDRKRYWFAALVGALVVGLPGVRASSLFVSVVAERFAPEAGSPVADTGRPVTYGLLDGGYIEAGDPIGGTRPPPAGLIASAMAQTLAERGFQPAAAGTSPTLLIVYHWGEIRHDSVQVTPPNSFKANDRARLQLVTRTAEAEKIESTVVNDRYNRMGLAALSLSDRERDALRFAQDDMRFVVVTAYEVTALQNRNKAPLWQTRMTTRAVGQSMSDALVSLIRHGGPYFGRDESLRQDTKREVVPAATTAVLSPVPGLNAIPAEVDPAFLSALVKTEHTRWSGMLPKN